MAAYQTTPWPAEHEGTGASFLTCAALVDPSTLAGSAPTGVAQSGEIAGGRRGLGEGQNRQRDRHQESEPKYTNAHDSPPPYDDALLPHLLLRCAPGGIGARPDTPSVVRPFPDRG